MALSNLSRFNIIKACQSDLIFGPWLKGKPSWQPWMVFLKCLFGEALNPQELDEVKSRTGRAPTADRRYSEAWLVVGRRGGKSFILAIVAVYLTFFVNWKSYLAPGEMGTVVIVAADRRQAQVILRYIKGLVSGIKFFHEEKGRETQWALEFPKQRITIEIFTTSFRSARGYTIVAALLDEVAFWRSEDTANQDEEIVNAIRPGMATVPGAMLLAASSPYAKRGVLYKQYNDYFGKEDENVLVWHADTRTMNPSVSQKYIDRQYELDPAKAAAEYGAQFRADVEDFVPEELVEAAIQRGVFRRPADSALTYFGFVDPSGGSYDSFTLAIGHMEKEQRILDVLEEWRPPFSPEAVVVEAALLLNEYRLTKIVGDHYAGLWPRERFKVRGITYEPCTKRKSELYRDALPSLSMGHVQLLDNTRLKAQIITLERRQSRGGAFIIDHPPGGKDDLANAALGLVAIMPAALVDYGADYFLVGAPMVSMDTPISNMGRL